MDDIQLDPEIRGHSISARLCANRGDLWWPEQQSALNHSWIDSC